MNDEWVELSVAVGHLVESITVRRADIYRILGSVYDECIIYLCDGSRIELAGEYDIVRDEITGGKWSIKRWLANHWTESCAKTLQAYQPIKPYLAPSDVEEPVQICTSLPFQY